MVTLLAATSVIAVVRPSKLAFTMKTVALALAFSYILNATPVTAQDQRTVSVVGKAQFEAKPDLATIELGISFRDRELLTAKSNVDQTIKDVAKAMEESGVESDRILRSNINISSYFPDDCTELTESLFVVTRNVTVTISTNLIASVLENATKAGVNEIEEIQYSVSNDTDLRQQTLAAAIKNAKEQAQFLAQEFDSKLGRVLKIQSDQYGYSPALSLVVSEPQDPFGDDSYVPNQITITSTVNVVFELKD